MIRARGIVPDELPIVALTANAFTDDITAYLEAGNGVESGLQF